MAFLDWQLYMALSRYLGNVLLKCTCTWVLLKQDSKQGEKHRK